MPGGSFSKSRATIDRAVRRRLCRLLHYICVLCVFAVMQLLPAIFLKETLEAATAYTEMFAAMPWRKTEAYLKQLRAFFDEADQSGDGVLDIVELHGLFKNPEVRI